MIKKRPFSALLTPILLVGILLFAGLVTYVSVSAYNDEQEDIRSYTHSRMKSLILDLELRLMPIESAIVADSHMDNISLDDSIQIYSRLEKLLLDHPFISDAGLDIWNGDGLDTGSTTLYVSRQSDGRLKHETIWMLNSDCDSVQMSYYDKAGETGVPVWSYPCVDSLFAKACVVTCYHQVAGNTAMYCVDVEMNRLMQTIDSLQFYPGSRMYLSVPGGEIYTYENGEFVNVDTIDMDEDKYTVISARYRHLNVDLIDVVPNEIINDFLWTRFFIILIIFILGLSSIAVLVHRSFSKAQKNLALSIKKANDEQNALKRIENEIGIAARIQNQMLVSPGQPRHFMATSDVPVDIMAYIFPAKEVGGDLYDYHIDGNILSICIGDVSGKGIPASMVMSKSSTLFHSFVSYISNPDPSELLGFLNRQLCRQNEELMFVTMWVGVLDLNTGHLKYSSAGHNPPVLVQNAKASFMELCQGLPLGMFEDVTYPLFETDLLSGDTLLLYTDGITEAESPEHVLFGDEKLLNVCRSACSSCPEVLCRTLLDAVSAHSSGCSQSDDITLLCFSFGTHFAQLHGISDVPALHTLVEECSQSDESALVLEEAAVNAFAHGGATFACVEFKDGVFTLITDGDDFNPMTYKIPDLSNDELHIGGRGIPLIRQLCRKCTFCRLDNGFNIQTFEL